MPVALPVVPQADVPPVVAAEVEPTRIVGRGVIARRILPHQLQHEVADGVRAARHEAEPEAFPLVRAEDAIDYGLWWHETLEFLPWSASPDELAVYAERAFAAADVAGFRVRAEE